MQVDSGNVLGVAAFAYGLMAVLAIMTSGLIYGMVKLLGAAQARKGNTSEAAPVRVEVTETPVSEDVGHVAAIAAAVFATVGAHRLVYIGEAAAGAWTSAGRVIHHTSHQPKRSPEA